MFLAILLFLACALCLACAVFSFLRRGPVLSIAYLLADKGERPAMRTSAQYAEAAIVFLSIGLGMLSGGLYTLLNWPWLQTAMVILLLIGALATGSRRFRFSREK